MSAEFDFEVAIRSAKENMDAETVTHQKRMEFWVGYITAMEEVQRHMRKTSCDT